jgi:trehalose 6-phosphate phosphatase
VARRLGVDGVYYEGLYGLGEAAEIDAALVENVRRVTADVEGAWVEAKGASVAVHYRKAADISAARTELVSALTEVTAVTGYEVVEGKMVLELLPVGRSRKGGAVEQLVRERSLQAVLYAGDDVADIEAFEALNRLAAQGLWSTTIAVGGPETPDPLLAAADVTVSGPSGLLDVLRQLA